MKRAVVAIGFLLLTVAGFAQDVALVPLVGLWRVSYSFTKNGSVITNGGREVVAMQPELTSLSWTGSSFEVGKKAGAPEYDEVNALLKRNPTGQGYLLNLKLGSGANGLIENMPLTYNAATGLSGTGTIKIDNKPLPAKASIVYDTVKMEHQWKIESTDGKIRYTLTFTKPRTTLKH